MKDKILAKLFEGFDASLLNDDLKEEVNGMIDELVTERVAAATAELKEKEKRLKEYALKLKEELVTKEKVMNEVCDEFAKELAAQTAEKERIMEEAIVEYNTLAESILANDVSEFKETILQVMEEENLLIQTKLQEVAIEQLSEYKSQQEAVTAKEVDAIKMELVEKMSEFMDKSLKESIPSEIMESAVKVAAYEPLVEGMIKTFSKGYLNFEGTGESVIREAKQENVRLSESLSAKVKDNVKLAAKVRELERNAKLSSLTEGMTSKQKVKMSALLEKHDLDSLEEGFNKYKDMIIEESVKTSKPKTDHMSSKVRSRVEKLQEGASLGVDPTSEIGQWTKALQRDLNQG